MPQEEEGRRRKKTEEEGRRGKLEVRVKAAEEVGKGEN